MPQVRNTTLWEFSKSPKIKGTLASIGSMVVNAGTAQERAIPTYIIETDTGRFKVLGSHKLQECIYSADVGKVVEITLKGEIKLKAGRRMNDFEVLVYDEGENVE